ncbi:S8 family serine peptidase [Cronobacter turicensis]|uniref:S8 family serine peptidase n=1 Tax=Cronobacter turicensis TaxID=413502 RepID=UPI0024C29105|nr:autotransporter serine protease [Cronobacter turicensis]MDK1184490.1 S8 family serine peptidase [Cronobacter turicensis]MDK1206995.1 S8 family serine peptidase [Cronobacter turicensis]MDK1213318.1 S8 family serine peptidase [Cronobacter turicensis]MDK1217629.1 S8 family serine peptidase [Cronobacter turicensis]MDK1230793.1 S8 family serine peptidase [Cronobacter turicensis]
MPTDTSLGKGTLLTKGRVIPLIILSCSGAASASVKKDADDVFTYAPSVMAADVVTRTNFNRPLFITSASTARAAGINGAGIKVGVADTGILTTHPALLGVVKGTLNYVDPNTNNLSVGDVRGHGTMVAQTLAGRKTDLFTGGTATGATLISARIIPDVANTRQSLNFGQINYDLARAGAKIINNSWGIPDWNPASTATTNYFVNAWKPFISSYNGLIVFASGNDGAANPVGVAKLPSLSPKSGLDKGWLVATAVDTFNPSYIASYANRCGVMKNSCLAAPGSVYVQSTDSTGKPVLRLVSGTSFAAPQVSGVAAMVWQKYPYFTNDLVRQTVLGTATDIGAPGVDAVFGYGLLNAAKAINGPAKFDWGTVSVAFNSYTSTWGNAISGSGGLVKSGTGKLVLTQDASYTGTTQVLGGTLSSAKSLASAVTIGRAGTLDVRTVKGNVDNSGYVLLRDGKTRFVRNYTQRATGSLAFMLGSTLDVTGRATLAGNLHLLGVPTGYVTQVRQPVVNAGALSGRFSRFTQSAGVFLTGSLGYSTKQVWLNIKRLQVTQTKVASTSAASLSGAARLEQAFTQLDKQVASGVTVRASSFASAAAELQRIPNNQSARAALESLSGQLPAATAALTWQAINVNQRSSATHISELLDAPQSRSWSDTLSWNGSLGRNGFSPVSYSMKGWVTGQDRFIDEHTFIGTSLSRTETFSALSSGGERNTGSLSEAALYGGKIYGGYYLTGRLASGYYDGQQKRMLWLGSRSERVNSRQSGSWMSLGSETGYRFSVEGLEVTPFIDTQYITLKQDAFSEKSASGFGLRADNQTTTRWQAGAGLRAAYAFDLKTHGRLDLSFQTHLQRALSQDEGRYQASFTGVDQSVPLHGVTAPEKTLTSAVSLGWQVNPALNLNLTGEQETSDGRNSNRSVIAGVSLSF